MPLEPPPPYDVHGVTVPGRTLSSTTLTTVFLSFHPDDAGEAEALVERIRTSAVGRTVSYEIR